MIGLDFGSTTSSAMIASAALGFNSITGRMAFGTPNITYRSNLVFTPFDHENIDDIRLSQYLDQWITESGVHREKIFAGGAIITGIAGKQANANAIARMVRARIGEAIIATADDPRLESWLAFMGSCYTLSRSHPETVFINIDIGGGTTNPALGINGNVISTGCFFVGARHLQFEPGTYRLIGISFYGRQLLNYLEIDKTIGDSLDSLEIDTILDFYVSALEAVVSADSSFFTFETERLLQQVPFQLNQTVPEAVITFSGGVGELIYKFSRGEAVPEMTFYGDLGIDFALRILRSPRLSAHVRTLVPTYMGRATIYGLAVHSTEVSGTTIFVSNPGLLPCRDMPVVARLTLNADRETIAHALTLALRSRKGACIQVFENVSSSRQESANGRKVHTSLAEVQGFAARLAENWERSKCVADKPLVLLVPGNYGHALGNYASDWGRSPAKLIVIDEIPDRHAHFVNIGCMHNNVVPVTFYGMQ